MLKKAFEQFLTVNPLLLILIILGLVFHFLLLSSPVGLTHDDADVVLSMKTLAEKGVDVSGTSFPTLLFFNKTQGNISGLASFIFSPIFKIFDLNLFNIHFLYVCINIVTLIMISLLTFRLTKLYNLSVFIFLIGLFNPWFFAYSRYPTEAPVALLFTLIALVFFYTKNKYNFLLSSLFFVFAFYSYYGAKISITLLFPILCFFNLKNIKKLTVAAVFFTPILFYFWISFFSTNSTLTKRLGNEFIFNNLDKYESQTNEFRKISIDSDFKNLFYNKYAFLTETIVKKYLGWMSPDVLFFEGDPVSVYRFTDHGLFYVLDIVLFVLGIAYFAVNSKRYNDLIILLLSLLVVAPIGSSISNIGTSYFFRSFLLLPPLLIILGAGMFFLQNVLNRLNLKVIWYLFLCLYFLLFTRFVFFYFYRYPVYSQENNFLSERVLSSYVNRLNATEKDIYVYVVNTESFKNLNILYGNDSNLNISNDCFAFDIKSIAIYDNALNCVEVSNEYLVISNQKDSGAIYKIYNDTLCDKDDLTAYKRNHLMSDYNIEGMSDGEFCNRWIQNEKTE